eukprot:gene12237-biopygen22952
MARAWRATCKFCLGWRGHGAGVARAWRGRGVLHAIFALGGVGMARAWRGRGAGICTKQFCCAAAARRQTTVLSQLWQLLAVVLLVFANVLTISAGWGGY